MKTENTNDHLDSELDKLLDSWTLEATQKDVESDTTLAMALKEEIRAIVSDAVEKSVWKAMEELHVTFMRRLADETETLLKDAAMAAAKSVQRHVLAMQVNQDCASSNGEIVDS